MGKGKITRLGITTPRGFRAAGGAFGIKASGKPDLALLVADHLCAAAAVFTTSRTPSAPVQVGRRHLSLTGGRARAIVCNSGNANASTGAPGRRDAINMCRVVARQIGCEPAQVLVSSTGIIGRPLPMDKINKGIVVLAGRLSHSPRAAADAARAILTTDLKPKIAYRRLTLDRRTVHLAGIAKGSGMIAPNLATMLAFLTTDAAISPGSLRLALRDAAGAFNRISVDEHTSPSDTVAILASGGAGNRPIRAGDKRYRLFLQTLSGLCADLAYQIVRDGEGATRVFRVTVTGARSVRDADRVGRAIVNSPLVKCAIHGRDPNWGRITTAAGYSGASLDPQRMSLHIGGVLVFEHGAPRTLRAAETRRLVKAMGKLEVPVVLHLGVGQAQSQWLGCDLSRQYVAINADYTT